MKNNTKISIFLFVIIVGLTLLYLNRRVEFFSHLPFLASPQDYFQEETVGDWGFGNSFALSPLGNPAVSFLDQEKGLIFSERINGQWKGEVIDSEGFAGQEVSIAFDKEGQANILYIDRNFSLKLAKKIGRRWKIEKIADGVALSLNLIFDNEGRAKRLMGDGNLKL